MGETYRHQAETMAGTGRARHMTAQFRLRRSDDIVERGSVVRSLTGTQAAVLASAALGLFAALVLKVSLMPLSNTDMTRYVLPWFEAKQAHGLGVLGMDVTDYSPFYSYLLLLTTLLPDWVKPLTAIKLVSVAGDAALAVMAGLLAHALTGDRLRGLVAGVVVFALPTVIVNGSAWGQTDAIWSAAILGAVLAMLRGRGAAAVLLYGLAVAYKPQAAFLGPILLAFLLSRRQARLLLLVPVPYLLLALPPILAGRPWHAVLGVYLAGFEGFDQLSYDAPGLWTWLQFVLPNTDGVVLAGLMLAAAAGGGLTLLALRGGRLHGMALLHGAALACALLPFLTPKMHSRYFFVAEVLMVLSACLKPALLPLAIASQTAALLAYQPFLAGLINWRVPLAVLFNLLAIGLLAWLWLRTRRAQA